jgi:hypothetical protein
VARRPWDILVAADLTGDGKTDVLIANNRDRWTGVLNWRDGAMHLLWGAPNPLHGPAGQWNRRDGDVFHAVDYQGRNAISVLHQNDLWHGILSWDGSALVPVRIERLEHTRGATPFVMGPRTQGNPSHLFRGTIVDGSLAPAGALVDTVRNVTRGTTSQIPDTVAMNLSHFSYPGTDTYLAPYLSQGEDISHAFSGQPIAGDWSCRLSGVAIETVNQSASVLITWHLP